MPAVGPDRVGRERRFERLDRRFALAPCPQRARPAELYSWNITGTSKLLEYCQAYRVPKVVLMSSANVYGPRPDNPQFLTEEAPLLAAQRFPQMRDLVEIDHLVSTYLWRAR